MRENAEIFCERKLRFGLGEVAAEKRGCMLGQSRLYLLTQEHAGLTTLP